MASPCASTLKLAICAVLVLSSMVAAADECPTALTVCTSQCIDGCEITSRAMCTGICRTLPASVAQTCVSDMRTACIAICKTTCEAISK